MNILQKSITKSRIFSKTIIISSISIISFSMYYMLYKNNSENITIKLEGPRECEDNIDDAEYSKRVDIDDVDDVLTESIDSLDSLDSLIISNEKVNIFCHYFNTSQKIDNGLKNIKKMPMTEVGFFDMGYLNNHTIWMRDTLIPLDILFLDNQNNIVDKIENTIPLSDKSLFVNKLSSYIIEANSGFYKKFNLKIGMNINDCLNLIMIVYI